MDVWAFIYYLHGLQKAAKEKVHLMGFFSEEGIKITLRQFKSQTMALPSLPLYVRQHLILLKVPEELFGMDFNPFVLPTHF